MYYDITRTAAWFATRILAGGLQMIFTTTPSSTPLFIFFLIPPNFSFPVRDFARDEPVTLF